MRFLLALALLAFAIPARAEPLKVVASFSILGDLVHQIGGDQVRVVTLVGPDADAHGFEAKPSDAKKLADADLLIVNGLGFDPWVDRLSRAAGFHGKRIVTTEAVRPIVHGSAPDPHAWQSVPNAILYVDAIVAGLAEARPDSADAFRAAGDAYKAKLNALDRDIRTAVAAIPAERRRIIVPHRAFAYYGQAYGLEFLAPIGTDADEEASAGRIAELAKRARAGQIGALFTEHLTDRRAVQRIAAEAGMKVTGELYSDALSPPSGPAATYIDLMRGNARIIANSLAASPEDSASR